ncbi:hypothetical protein ACFWGI_16750 [Streptomyces niveus]
MNEQPHQQFQAAADPVGEIDWAVAADKAYGSGARRQCSRAVRHPAHGA